MPDKENKELILLTTNEEACVRWNEQVLAYFHDLLFSSRPPSEAPECIRDDPRTADISRVVSELRTALRMASKGDFSYVVSAKGYMGGLLKSLQANLNHIAWLTRQVADGDLSQRMDFMGDFASAFNSMVDELSCTLEELKAKQEGLALLAEELQNEVEERKAAEEKLRQEEERWQLAVQCSRDGIWDVNLESGEPPYYSERLLELTGLRPEEVPSIRDWVKLFHPDDREVQDLFQRFANNDSFPESFTIDHKLLCADGNYRWFMTRGMAVLDPATRRPTRLIGVTADIQERKEREELFSHRATHDVLTELPNRALFNEHLKTRMDFAKRNGSHLAIIMADLDNFKQINDTLGHHVGDLLLIETSFRLQQNIRESDIVARFGGDEFALLISFGKTEWQVVTKVLERTIQALQKPICIEGNTLSITISLGVSIYPEDGDEAQKLMIQADEALYHAKAMGRNAYVFWKPDKQYDLFKFQNHDLEFEKEE